MVMTESSYTEALRSEYEAARSAAGVIVRDDRRIVRVHGRDPVKMVHGLVTNDVQNMSAEQAVYAVLLTPKGRMVGDMRVLRQDADLLLDVDAGALDGVMAHLKKFVPPLFAKFDDVSADYAMLGVYGPASQEVVEKVVGPLARELGADDAARVTYGEGSIHAIGTRYPGDAGIDLLVTAADAEQVHAALLSAGAAHMEPETLEVLRIEAGQPRWGAELDENVIPLEAGLKDRAISMTKGCYTGQEVIIRILHRGHVNWELRGLLLGASPVPARGATLHRPGETKSVARVTSAAVSPRYGQTIALAYVRREVEAGAQLEMEGAEHVAEVVTLPFDN